MRHMLTSFMLRILERVASQNVWTLLRNGLLEEDELIGREEALSLLFLLWLWLRKLRRSRRDGSTAIMRIIEALLGALTPTDILLKQDTIVTTRARQKSRILAAMVVMVAPFFESELEGENDVSALTNCIHLTN